MMRWYFRSIRHNAASLCRFWGNVGEKKKVGVGGWGLIEEMEKEPLLLVATRLDILSTRGAGVVSRGLAEF